ncbi:hypothetical protein GSI_01441 [Ganoderma sinense ZZ0214-1]|uniref:RWD domain-containing protein n=1 Tax=Ganoderma sinense ZZ0214-1 TaxID=1077348 RepID=A0A2G8SVF1_9APHY|nr:hypothetical protein GSI_01441 [Ganoderma sinense ZZ0214-1]
MTSTPDTIADLIDQLTADPDPTREAIALELGVLQSIYGEEAVTIWKPSSRASSKSPPPDRGALAGSQSLSTKNTEPGTIRYEVTLRALTHAGLSIDTDDPAHPSPHPVSVHILVSLPPSYPTSAPPQLQLLSRYIGPYGVDAPLFGTVLRTYISRGAVEWTPGAECVFDGLEWVKERCAEWMGERLSERVAGEIMREDERGRGHEGEGQRQNGDGEVRDPAGKSGGMVRAMIDATPAEMPPGITIVEAEPILDRKSSFVGRACRVTDPSQHDYHFLGRPVASPMSGVIVYASS